MGKRVEVKREYNANRKLQLNAASIYEKNVFLFHSKSHFFYNFPHNYSNSDFNLRNTFLFSTGLQFINRQYLLLILITYLMCIQNVKRSVAMQNYN